MVETGSCALQLIISKQTHSAVEPTLYVTDKKNKAVFSEDGFSPLSQTAVLLRFVIIHCIMYIYSASKAAVAMPAMIVSNKHHIIAKY